MPQSLENIALNIVQAEHGPGMELLLDLNSKKTTYTLNTL
jgi:hypothetical protein